MSIIVHTGHPRQGKSYSAVLAIIQALVSGRRVVTNIEGMGVPKRIAKLQAAVEKRGGTWRPELFKHVPHSEVEKALIFPVDMKRENEDGVREFDDSKSLLKFGDLLVWDEARLWKTGKLPEIWADALDYHGHWSRNGFATDLLLITPIWMNLAPTVRRIAEIVYWFDKHPGGKSFTRYMWKTPGDKDLTPGPTALDIEDFTFDPNVSECYATNNDPDAQFTDTLIVPPWKTARFWKKIGVGVGLIVIPVGLLVWFFVMPFFRADPAPQAAAQVVQDGAAPSNVPSSSAPSAGGFGALAGGGTDNTPRVVGMVPAARGGMRAIVRVGQRFEFVPVRSGTILFHGKALPWPDDF